MYVYTQYYIYTFKSQAVGLNLLGLFSKYFLNQFSCASKMFNIYM